MGLLAVRFLFAAIFFEILRLLKVIKIDLNKRKIKKLLIIALFQPVLYFVFETYGLMFSTSGEAGIMISLIPLFVTVLSALFLNERASLGQVFFIILSVSGVILIQVSNHKLNTNPNWWGFILLMGAVLSSSLYNIFARKSVYEFTPVEGTYFMMLISAISFNIIYIIKLLTKGNIVSYLNLFTSVNLIIPITYLSVFSSVVAFFLVNYSLKRLPAHISAVYTNLSTVVTLLAGYFILKEKFTIYHVIGSIIIIIGIYGTMYLSQKTSEVQIQK